MHYPRARSWYQDEVDFLCTIIGNQFIQEILSLGVVADANLHSQLYQQRQQQYFKDRLHIISSRLPQDQTDQERERACYYAAYDEAHNEIF